MATSNYKELRIRLKDHEKALIERVSALEGFGASGTQFCRWVVLDWIEKKYPSPPLFGGLAGQKKGGENNDGSFIQD